MRKNYIGNLIIPIICGCFCAYIVHLNQKQQQKHRSSTFNARIKIIATHSGSFTVDDLRDFFTKRLNKLSLEYHLNVSGRNTAEIFVKGAKDTSKLKSFLTHLPVIRIMEIYPPGDIQPILTNAHHELLAGEGVDTAQHPATGSDTSNTDIDALVRSLETESKKESARNAGLTRIMEIETARDSTTGYFPAEAGFINCNDTMFLRDLVARQQSQNTGPPGAILRFGKVWDAKTCSYGKHVGVYFIRPPDQFQTILKNKDIASAAFFIEGDTSMHVNIEFTEEGSSKWEALTRDNLNSPIAIIVDDEVVFSPHISEVITTGAAKFSGFLNTRYAGELADLLNTGGTPDHLMIESAVFAPQFRRRPVKRAVPVLLAFAVGFFTAFFLRKALKNN